MIQNSLKALSLSAIAWMPMMAQANSADQIEVKHAYVREVPPTAMATAAFMTLKNNGDHAILLTKADSRAAKIVQLHTHIHDNGVMKMRQVPNIRIPAHGETKLQPGGYHIMLIQPVKPLKQGNQVKITLTFDDGSHKTITAPVKSVMGMSMHHMMQH